ncbi:hypothetical protein PPL_08672 [Heterostelium album PN500]|uniref:Ankyrin repeat-containing protein n=1 Tax=Heterostelium pallidum (strain ATCC 26659 / Pp 5 / PN500) TaxID=670386 RepID=D3BJE7_HETP5|nr:hypothetical protein PPL_08672 [Heterostelium album PN500]EFA78027.1 hypothetical protein PPL_08672 [Heterostelium album PN500]|eukprot:XP_020430155.1 hypothetical protein PPL_08672 [Heterostelium album PN500]
MIQNKEYTTILFKRLLHSVVLRNKIFQSVRDIHDQLAINSLRCDWYDLACFPDQLIKFNYIERYKQICNTLIRNKIEYNNHIEEGRIVLNTIRKFRQLYLDSSRNAFDVGNLDVLEFIQKLFPLNELEYTLYVNRDHYMNNLEIIQFLHNKAPRWFKSQGSRVLNNVALGSFQVFKWLYENRSERPASLTYFNAVSSGNLEIIKYLNDKEKQTKTPNNLILNAAVNGQLETLKYLHENMKLQCDSDIVEQVVGVNEQVEGHLAIVKYLMENTKQQLPNTLIDEAAKNGQIELVKYLVENTTAKLSSITMDAVACHGDLEFLKQLHSKHHINCTSTAMHMAAVNGHVEVVRFLNENRTEGCRKDTMKRVAMNVHFETFKYLFQNKKELDIPTNSIDFFAKYKDISALQWFKDNTTLQCSQYAYRYAIRQANLPVIEWIRDNTSLPFPSNSLEYASKLENSDLRIVQYLHANGETCSVKELKSCHKLSIFKFLYYTQSLKSDKETLKSAIEKNNVPIIKFLLQNSTDEYLDYSQQSLKDNKTFDYPSRLKLIKQYGL